MDIFFRLRFVFWVLVAALWGMLFKQFYVDEPLKVPTIQTVQNPFRSSAASVPGLPTPRPEEPRAAPGTLIQPFLPPSVDRVAKEEEGAPTPPLPRSAGEGDNSAVPAATANAPETAAAKAFVRPVAAPGYQGPAEKTPAPSVPEARPAEEPVVARPAPAGSAPPGFVLVQTPHFRVYAQSRPSPDVLKDIEAVQSNIMLDLAPFAPWTNDQKVSLYLFDDQASYRKHTGRPEWSGGASSLSRRAVYVYKSEEFLGIFAHELTHMYFEPFFGSKLPPMWLDEGLATLEQSEKGFAPPNWLSPNLQTLTDGGGFPVTELVRVNTTAGADDDSVRLWYAESYSVVRFLLRMQRGPSFLYFCRELRDGKDIHQALLDAYGMPFNRLRSLELAWRYDLQTHKLTRLAALPNPLP